MVELCFHLMSLKKTGLQVELDCYKAGGKFGYHGLVNMGDIMPWKDNFMTVAEENQTAMNVGSLDLMILVVSDTSINFCDPNYNLLENRVRSDQRS
jgi:hypothetical protein